MTIPTISNTIRGCWGPELTHRRAKDTKNSPSSSFLIFVLSHTCFDIILVVNQADTSSKAKVHFHFLPPELRRKICILATPPGLVPVKKDECVKNISDAATNSKHLSKHIKPRRSSSSCTLTLRIVLRPKLAATGRAWSVLVFSISSRHLRVRLYENAISTMAPYEGNTRNTFTLAVGPPP
ncbi:hypothetical protein F4818DRAFT_430952 [Hypoxylon cercidicola]|nr:hypothetical protein F4818DRAFT_430952 [Hypoxylon cercidicola]